MKTRIPGYDLAKSLAMFLVVLLHYSFYTRFYSSGIAGNMVTVACLICVPLFFAVNGALLLPRPLDVKKHYIKVCKIIGILAVWKTIAALFCVVVDRTHVVGIKDFLIFQLGGAFGEYPLGYFWFMHALVAVYLVYPLIKLAFDAKSHSALYAVMLVIFCFTFCKDTLRVILDMFGTVLGVDFTVLFNSLGEYYIFGAYGYTLLYFIGGGLIAQRYYAAASTDSDSVSALGKGELLCLTPSSVRITPRNAVFGVLACYVIVFLIQRFQHYRYNVNLSVDYGYWLLPTLIATFLVLLLCLRYAKNSNVVTGIGKNTFGIYMLHLFALVSFAKIQDLPMVAGLFAHITQGWLATVVNVICTMMLFGLCCVISMLLRKLPLIRMLFSL